MMRDIVTKISIALVVVCLLLVSCGEVVTELPLTPVFLIPQLNLELDNFIGEKVWVSGYYGDDRISGEGYGFLVTDFDMLLFGQELPEHCCALLDGELPGYTETGAEILVYGEVKEFGEAYDAFTLEPTALITVEEYNILPPPAGATNSSDSLLDVSFDRAVPEDYYVAEALNAGDGGKEATNDDRALILSGGVDDKSNHSYYKDSIKMAYEKLIHLGFNDEQIVVLYNDGKPIYDGATNITDGKASKDKVKETLTKFQNEMKPGSTLVIFVTDHGTGYSPAQGYDGARPATTRERGITYSESDIKVDLRDCVVCKRAAFFNLPLVAEIDARGVLVLKVKGVEKVRHQTADGNRGVSEQELGLDINQDQRLETRRGINTRTIERQLRPVRGQKKDAPWDTDRNCSVDVRATWNNTTQKYVLERLRGADWQKMAESTTGSYIIEGVDWDLNGNTNGQIGFHEGINLWGKEVLWDYELRDLLEPLYDKRVCILVMMDSCFSGGFVENLKKVVNVQKGVVEIIVTFAGEDTRHCIRAYADGSFYSATFKGFIDNLAGIDLASWETAFKAAKKADEDKWKAEWAGVEERGQIYKNEYVKWKTDTPRDCQVSSNFTDPTLEYIIRTIIGIPEDTIYPSDLEGIEELDASGQGITDLTGLEYCTSLEYVDLGFNQISDISPLVNLTKLEYLDLEFNKISDISPLLQNEGLGTGDFIYLRDNPLFPASISIYIPQLRGRDMAVDYDCSWVTAGASHTVGLRSDGTVVAAGDNDYGQCNVGGWTDIVQVSAGYTHTVGLRSDGTVVATGWNEDGQCNVGGWTDIMQVAANGYHTLGLRSDGTVVAVGSNTLGQCNVGDWADIVQVAPGYLHTVGLKSDGTVVAVGGNADGACDVGGWTDIVQIAADSHTVGLRADGTVVATGWNEWGQCDVDGWTNIVQVAAGQAHTVGLTWDGTAVAAGYNSVGQCNVSSWGNICQIAGGAGGMHSVGLRWDGTVVAVGDNSDEQCNVGGWMLRWEMVG